MKLCPCGRYRQLNMVLYPNNHNFFFSVRLLSVLHGHSVFSSPRPQPSKVFYPRFYPLHFCSILILQKEPVFPFLVLSAKQGNYWYHFYNVFGMTRSRLGIEQGTARTRSHTRNHRR